MRSETWFQNRRLRRKKSWRGYHDHHHHRRTTLSSQQEGLNVSHPKKFRTILGDEHSHARVNPTTPMRVRLSARPVRNVQTRRVQPVPGKDLGTFFFEELCVVGFSSLSFQRRVRLTRTPRLTETESWLQPEDKQARVLGM